VIQKSLIAQLPVEWRERRRLQRRFARIEKTLRARDCTFLPPELQQNRRETLDNLHSYAKRGIFPRNFAFPNKHRPVFIDPGGRTCAVAQLMIDSGAGYQAAKISSQANFAYIREMNFVELDNWVAESGLGRDEAAWIQPGYEFMNCPDYSLQLTQARQLLQHINTQIILLGTAYVFVAWLRSYAKFRQNIKTGLAIILTVGLIVLSGLIFKSDNARIDIHNIEQAIACFAD